MVPLRSSHDPPEFACLVAEKAGAKLLRPRFFSGLPMRRGNLSLALCVGFSASVYPFKKAQSGNPGDRPKEVAEVKALARAQTTIAINTLVSIAKSKKATDAARVSACVALLDRGWGKPDKTHHHEGDVRQHIISDRPLTADEWRDKYCRPEDK